MYQYLRSKDSESGLKGTPYYIGKGKGNRCFVNHRSFKPPKDEFIFIYADQMSEEDAFTLEIMLIARYGRLDLGTGCLRNRTDGSDGFSGIVPSPESIEKRRKANLGRKRSPESRARMSAAQVGNTRALGHKHTPEARANMSEARKGIVFTDEHRLNISESHKGQTLSAEHKKKISSGLKGKPLSAAHRASLSRSRKGIIFSAEHRENIRKATTGVIKSAETRAKSSAALKGKPWSASRRAAYERSI